MDVLQRIVEAYQPDSKETQALNELMKSQVNPDQWSFKEDLGAIQSTVERPDPMMTFNQWIDHVTFLNNEYFNKR